jgi:hypothetical protein
MQLEDKEVTKEAKPSERRRAGQFEELRSRLAEMLRSHDGSTRYAAHLTRVVVEDSDLMLGTEGFKAPFDQARALARARACTRMRKTRSWHVG